MNYREPQSYRNSNAYRGRAVYAIALNGGAQTQTTVATAISRNQVATKIPRNAVKEGV